MTLSPKVVGAGAFLVVGVFAFTAALFMIGDRRMLFETRFPVYTEFANLGQLQSGAIVRVGGLDAGEVTDIQIPQSPAGKFRVRMSVREDVHQLIRTDSIATSQTEGLVGGIFVNVTAGTERAPRVAEGGTIPSHEPFAIADLLKQASDSVELITMTVEALRGDAEKAVQQIALTAEDAHALVEEIGPDLTAIVQNGNRISSQTRLLVTNINEGKGTIGKLVNDDALYVQARAIAEQARAVMENVQQVSADARGAISDLRSQSGPAQGLMADMRVTLNHAREATSGLAENMEAMKHNFLLRGFFNQRGYFDLDGISPAEYRKGVLENGKRKAMRIWLADSVLFERTQNGAEVLTEDGRARLDNAMATYLKYIPGSPLVVEGYATQGTETDRFQRARSRAGAVLQYLEGKFDLMPNNTGSVALSGEAKDSPSGSSWDGIALTLFVNRQALQFADPPATK